MKLRPLNYHQPIPSAQVKSCLLLAGLAADGPTIIYEPGISRDHTERMLSTMGVQVTSEITPGPGAGAVQNKITLIPPDELRFDPLQLSIPGDISAAAFFIRNVGLNPTRTGLLDALETMGAKIQVHPQPAIADDPTSRSTANGEPMGDIVVSYSQLEGAQIHGSLVVRMIDEFPIFAVAAAYAQGRTTICDAQELRHKESDRISALCAELAKIGVHISEKPDGFEIHGRGQIPGGDVDPHGDHRLAMALTVAGLAANKSVTVRNSDLASESFPDFFHQLSGLGAHLNIQKDV